MNTTSLITLGSIGIGIYALLSNKTPKTLRDKVGSIKPSSFDDLFRSTIAIFFDLVSKVPPIGTIFVMSLLILSFVLFKVQHITHESQVCLYSNHPIKDMPRQLPKLYTQAAFNYSANVHSIYPYLIIPLTMFTVSNYIERQIGSRNMLAHTLISIPASYIASALALPKSVCMHGSATWLSFLTGSLFAINPQLAPTDIGVEAPDICKVPFSIQVRWFAVALMALLLPADATQWRGEFAAFILGTVLSIAVYNREGVKQRLNDLLHDRVFLLTIAGCVLCFLGVYIFPFALSEYSKVSNIFSKAWWAVQGWGTTLAVAATRNNDPLSLGLLKLIPIGLLGAFTRQTMPQMIGIASLILLMLLTMNSANVGWSLPGPGMVATVGGMAMLATAA